MKISKTTPLEELIPYFAELALSRGLDEQPSTDRQELVARIKELEALPVKNADGDDSESGTESDAEDDSATGTEGAGTGDGSESGTEGAGTGDGSEAGTEVAGTGDGSETGTEGAAAGDGSESGTEGAAAESDEKLVNIKPLCSIRCSHGQQRYNIDGNSKSVAVPESLANDLVNGKYAVLI